VCTDTCRRDRAPGREPGAVPRPRAAPQPTRPQRASVEALAVHPGDPRAAERIRFVRTGNFPLGTEAETDQAN
jgi:hypothetical protein